MECSGTGQILYSRLYARVKIFFNSAETLSRNVREQINSFQESLFSLVVHCLANYVKLAHYRFMWPKSKVTYVYELTVSFY